MRQLTLNLKQPIDPTISISKTVLNSLPYNSLEIQRIISKIYIGQTLEDDTLGILFEKLVDEIERKNSGQFYTPKEIVDYIIGFLNIKPSSQILDPTCGCGIFLSTAYRHLRKLNKKALKNIYGVDLNKTAVELARTNLWLKDGMRAEMLKILESNIRVGNSIVENERLDNRAFKWRQEFNQVLKNGGFDFIIGNPPYVTLKKGEDYDIKEPSFSQIVNGPINAASLIIVRSFNLLKNGGIMSFVLPKALLRVNSYSRLRQFILDNCKVLHIVDLGNYFADVRGEQILLFLQKTSSKNEIRKNQVLVKPADKNKSLFKQAGSYISQGLFKKYDNFLVFDNKQFYFLIDKINNSGKPLEQFADIFRGITLSPTSDLIQRNKNRQAAPIIKGNDISKLSFNIKYFIDLHKLSNNLAKIRKLRRKKIVLQNIFSSESGIICAFDSKGYLTFDTVTNIVIKTNDITFKYLLSLLNSKLINFYLIYALFNKSKLTMHTDGAYLGKLPIAISGVRKQKILERLLEMFEKTKDKTILKELDKQIYDIYKIGVSEQKIIDDALRSIMSPKSFW